MEKTPETKAELTIITYDGEEILERALSRVKEYEHVVVVASRRDGGRELIHSTMQMRDQALLSAFFAARVADFFNGAVSIERVNSTDLDEEEWDVD